MDRQFVSDLLNVRWFDAHEIDLTTFDLGGTRAVVYQEFRPPVRQAQGQTARSPPNHSRLVRERSPKIAVPTRTSVAPSSTAIGKSFVIPMDRWGSFTSNSFSSTARNSRSRTKDFRDASASSATGGIIIKPSIDNRGNASSNSISARTFSGLKPNLLPSPATFTSRKTRGNGIAARVAAIVDRGFDDNPAGC